MSVLLSLNLGDRIKMGALEQLKKRQCTPFFCGVFLSAAKYLSDLKWQFIAVTYCSPWGACANAIRTALPLQICFEDEFECC